MEFNTYVINGQFFVIWCGPIVYTDDEIIEHEKREERLTEDAFWEEHYQ